MEEYDHKRSSNAKLSELEKEAKDKANYLLSKANLQLEEQEDDIKHLNELMLYAKCVAIRDIQVEEKEMIKREKKKEEARLDQMMEAERVADLKRLDEREKKRVEGIIIIISPHITSFRIAKGRLKDPYPNRGTPGGGSPSAGKT